MARLRRGRRRHGPRACPVMVVPGHPARDPMISPLGGSAAGIMACSAPSPRKPERPASGGHGPAAAGCYDEQSERKMNISPYSSRCWPCGHAAGKRPLQHGIFFLFSRTRLWYINRRPCPRVRPSRPGGTLPSGHAGRYSSCHCNKVIATAVVVTESDSESRAAWHGHRATDSHGPWRLTVKANKIGNT